MGRRRSLLETRRSFSERRRLRRRTQAEQRPAGVFRYTARLFHASLPESDGGCLGMSRADSGFARVYDEHVFRVYGFLAYRVHDHALAEDLTQATFERALRSWAKFDPRRATERTWLLAIAHNLLIDHYRRERVRSSEPISEQMLRSVSGPDERFDRSPELLDALAQLSRRDQEVLALRFGGELTGREIAALLGLSLPNVQQIVSRSLRKLREILEQGQMTPVPTSAPTTETTDPAAMNPAVMSRRRAGRGP
jgi:RNA polymerase sigma factor (sigma-70 family)